MVGTPSIFAHRVVRRSATRSRRRAPTIRLPDNPLTDDGATLGRVLFYDTRLSANGTVSCGSCHVQANAFADPKRTAR
jgi:cytochrome c peroxidase